MLQIRTVQPQVTEPDSAIASLQQSQSELALQIQRLQAELQALNQQKAASDLVAGLSESLKQIKIDQQQFKATIQNFELSLNGLIKSVQEITEPAEPTTPTPAMPDTGWIRFEQNPSFSLNMTKSQNISVTDSVDGLRFISVDAPTWQDVAMLRGVNADEFVLDVSTGKSLYLSLKIDSLVMSNHLFGLIDADFDINNVEKAYQQCAVGTDFSSHGLMQQHRLYGRFATVTAGGSAMPSNGAQVTLKFTPLLSGGFADVALYHVSEDNWDITSNSFKIFSIGLPQAVTTAKMIPCVITHGTGVIWLSGIKIS